LTIGKKINLLEKEKKQKQKDVEFKEMRGKTER
jgi:hypothetical protein